MIPTITQENADRGAKRSYNSIRRNNQVLGGKYTLNINGFPTDIVGNILHKFLLKGDFTSFMSLACTNVHCYKSMQELVNGNDIKQLCPQQLTIIDAQAQGRKVDDEPCIKTPRDKLRLFKCIEDLAPYVENHAGLTLLTMVKDLTLNQLAEIAKDAGITIRVYSSIIDPKVYNDPIEETYRIVISNGPLTETRSKSYDDQEECVLLDGFDGLPTCQEYVALSIYQNILYGTCLFGKNPETHGRSCTHVQGEPLIVGDADQRSLAIHDASFSTRSFGAAGALIFS